MPPKTPPKTSRKSQAKTHRVNSSIRPASAEIQQALVDGVSVHTNVGDRLVSITESKIRICLMRYIDNFKQGDSWQVPAGIAFTILLTFITTTFRDFGFSKDTWQAVFFICFFIATALALYRYFKRPPQKTIEDIIDELIPPDQKSARPRH